MTGKEGEWVVQGESANKFWNQNQHPHGRVPDQPLLQPPIHDPRFPPICNSGPRARQSYAGDSEKPQGKSGNLAEMSLMMAMSCPSLVDPGRMRWLPSSYTVNSTPVAMNHKNNVSVSHQGEVSKLKLLTFSWIRPFMLKT